jgi:hypothetical protein
VAQALSMRCGALAGINPVGGGFPAGGAVNGRAFKAHHDLWSFQDMCASSAVERDGSRRSDRSIDRRRGSGRAAFVAMMQPADLAKCDNLAC